MIWDIVPDIVSGINQIGVFLSDLPSVLLNNVLSMGLLVVYPFLKFMDLVIFDVTTVYAPFAELINQLIQIQQLPSMIFTVAFPLPSEWTMIILFQISISLFVRLYRWVASIPILAVIFGGGQ